MVGLLCGLKVQSQKICQVFNVASLVMESSDYFTHHQNCILCCLFWFGVFSHPSLLIVVLVFEIQW